MEYEIWKKKTLKNKKVRNAYIKLLEKYVREYERYFLSMNGELPESPKDIRRYPLIRNSGEIREQLKTHTKFLNDIGYNKEKVKEDG